MVVPVTVGGELGGSKFHDTTVSAVQMEREANAIPKAIGIVFMWLNQCRVNKWLPQTTWSVTRKGAAVTRYLKVCGLSALRRPDSFAIAPTAPCCVTGREFVRPDRGRNKTGMGERIALSFL